PAADAPPTPPEPERPLAVVDMGASAIRLLVAEKVAGQPPRILEEVSRGVLLGKDTFSSGRLGAATIEATLKGLEGFRRIMDTYGFVGSRRWGPPATREAHNREPSRAGARPGTGMGGETTEGSEETRLTYTAVREALRDHEAFTTGDALLAEIGGGSADISFL